LFKIALSLYLDFSRERDKRLSLVSDVFAGSIAHALWVEWA